MTDEKESGSSPLTDAEKTEIVRNKGEENGLFRAVMDKIKHSHTVGQKVRTAFVLSGVFSDQLLYAELLTQFAVTTAVFEDLLKERGSKSIANLDYNFSPLYSLDLSHLLGPSSYTEKTSELASNAAKEYITLLKEHSKTEFSEESLVAAVMILWGPLIIGGGAMMAPKVKKSYGAEATNVFQPVIGAGREQRRRDFIEVIDAAGKSLNFDKIVEFSGCYMEKNNAMMLEIKRRPWWFKWAIGAGISVVVGVYLGAKRVRNSS